MIYIFIVIVVLFNSVVLGYLLSDYFKKRFRENLEKELQVILNLMKELDLELKNSFEDVPKLSEDLAEAVTPFIKTYVSEAIDKYVDAEKEKLNAVLIPQDVNLADVEFLPADEVEKDFRTDEEIDDLIAAQLEEAFGTEYIEEKEPEGSSQSNDKVADYSDKYLKRPDISLNNFGVKRIAIPPELWHTIHSLAYANASGSQNIEPLSMSAVAFNIINEHFQTHAEEIAVLADRGSEKMLRGYDRY